MNRLPGDYFTKRYMDAVHTREGVLKISIKPMIGEVIDAVIMYYRNNPTPLSVRVDERISLHNAGIGIISVVMHWVIHCIEDPHPCEHRDEWISRVYDKYLNIVMQSRGKEPGIINKQVARQVISKCADRFFN